MPLRCVLVATLLLMLPTLPAFGEPPGHRHRLSPLVRVWLASPFLRRGQDLRVGEAPVAPVSVRFAAAPSPKVLTRLRSAGVEWLPGRGGEEPLHLGVFYFARATAGGAEALARAPEVAQVDLDVQLVPRVPLDLTTKDIQTQQAWAEELKGVPLTGQGVLIGSIDSGVDLYHPAFFRADGGLFEWVDADKNGRLDPGTDAVDLNGNGLADKGETLSLWEARVWDRAYQKEILAESGTSPDRDWLYVDTNGNGRRDFGKDASATEGSPGLGEPVFVAEDLDGDGAVDPEEKLVALKTSKVQAVSLNGVQTTRGKDLLSTVVSKEASHGTGTSGILLGGQRGRSRWTGIAPEAELLMGNTPTDRKTPLSSLIAWLAQAKAQLVLHEYAPYTGYHLDGSSNHEKLMDEATKLGIPQITPAGNLGQAEKHMQTTVAAGTTKKIPLDVPGPSYFGTHYYMQVTLLWRSTSVDLSFTLTDPTGKKNTLPTTNTSGQWWGDGKTAYFSYRQDSSRGTAMMDVILYAVDSSGTPLSIAQGAWSLDVTHPGGGGPLALWGYVGDAITSWNKGVAFKQDLSQNGLVCFPATADSAITVAAYAGHVGTPYEPQPQGDKSGDLRAYSGRGVRVDGTQIMDITAPDNPVAPMNYNYGMGGVGGYLVFGGTSGAGPHVAAAAALLKQQSPNISGDAVKAALRKGALADAQTGAVPSATWGQGKLRIYRTLFNKDPATNTAPTAQITVSGKAYVGFPVTLTPVVKDAEDAPGKLRIRWDRDYDGTWDTAAGPVAPLAATFTRAGRARYKLEVRDSGNLVGEAAVLLDVLPASERPDLGALTPDGGASAGDGGGGGGESDDSGCGCRVGDAGAAPGLLLLAALLIALRRRPAGSEETRAKTRRTP